jgi:cell wall-associated NlpC family hydrolase
VRYVYALHGIVLPRTAHEQAAVGEAPAPGDSLAPGDLLFFWGGRGAQHIAIYIGGDSIIHASSTAHRVRLDRLTKGGRLGRTWFNQRLIAVRRLLPEQGVSYVPATATSFSFIPGGARAW